MKLKIPSYFRRKDPGMERAQHLRRALKGIIIVSPLVWILVNALILSMAFMLMPDRMIMPKSVELFQIFLMLNGWFWAGMMFTYLLRDQSRKIITPNISASLGKDDGFLSYAPPMIKDSKMVEPQFTLRTAGGFDAMHVNSYGKTIFIYPTKYEVTLPKGGIAVYAWLRACTIDQIAENARVALQREGVAQGIFVDPNTEVWFSRTIFDVGRMAPNREDLAWDLASDEMISEINRLKAIVQEKDFQIESYELGRSRRAFMERPANEDFRSQYQRPSQSVGERSMDLLGTENEGLSSDYERRKRWKYP
jgi:hypothetical protein